MPRRPMAGAFARDRRGGIAMIAALAGGLLCALAALTVDVGSVALRARQLQGAADLAALSGARDIAHADAAARATASANVGQGVAAVVTIGRYTADRAIAPADRFVGGGADPNAVRVTLTDEAPLYFGRFILGRSTLDLRRSGTASASLDAPRAMFTIGSRLAALDGGIANQLLSGLTGSSVSLSVMDYNALASAQVNLLGFSDALSTRLGLTVGDYDGLLSRSIDTGTALQVLQSLAGAQSSSALARLSQAASGKTVKIGDLIGLSSGNSSGLDVSVSAMDLAMAMLEVGAGNRQIALTTGAQAGIADLKLSLAIGERPNHSPWLTVTDKGEPIVRTAQARLYVRALTAQKLSGLTQVNLPILIELAPSEARLDAIACTPARAVTLGVRPGLAKATIGTIDETKLGDFIRPLTPAPATLMSVAGLVTLSGSATVEAADQGFAPTPFTDAQITAQTQRTVTATGLANGLIVTLLQKMQVNVQVVGLGLGLGGIVQALGVLLQPLGPVLDGVINPILNVLGLKFGQADVSVMGATCPKAGGRAVLVG